MFPGYCHILFMNILVLAAVRLLAEGPGASLKLSFSESDLGEGERGRRGIWENHIWLPSQTYPLPSVRFSCGFGTIKIRNVSSNIPFGEHNVWAICLGNNTPMASSFPRFLHSAQLSLAFIWDKSDSPGRVQCLGGSKALRWEPMKPKRKWRKPLPILTGSSHPERLRLYLQTCSAPVQLPYQSSVFQSICMMSSNRLLFRFPPVFLQSLPNLLCHNCSRKTLV